MADALRITAPANLPAVVKAAFSRARENGDLTYYRTQVALLTATPTPSASSSPSPSPSTVQHQPAAPPFQLRFSPSLASKPKNPKPSTTGEKKTPFNPFANPDPALVIAKLGQQHTLVLNKFAIVPRHFLVITNSFKSQTHLLGADDLEAAYSCVRAYSQDAARVAAAAHSVVAEQGEGEKEGDKGGGSELFVFFNSGPFSGASQPHRHLQLLPVESMRVGLVTPTPTTTASGGASGTTGNADWTPLINTLHRPTPTIEAGRADGSETTSYGPVLFRIFSAQITPDMLPAERHAVYMNLYRRACEAVHAYEIVQRGAATSPAPTAKDEQQTTTGTAESTGEGGVAHEGDEAQISYNLAMTTNVMALCPRLAEGSAICDDNDVPIGKMELNGTVLAGTALVKSKAEWDAVRRNPELLQDVLSKIGIPTRATGDTPAGSIRESSL